MGDNKRKRGRKPKNRATETPDFQTTTTTSAAASSPAIDGVDFMDDPSIAQHLRRRPRQNPDNPDKTLIPSPTRRIESNGIHNLVSVEARTVPSMDAVMKVFCTYTEPNFSLPWQRKRQYSSSSSGFVIGGRRVLTNAHSVEHYTQVKLKKRGSETKYVATVLAIGTECDIGENIGFFNLKILTFVLCTLLVYK